MESPSAAITAVEPSAATVFPDKASGKRIVAIDVGHSKTHPGAMSATGIPEYQFNRRMAERLHAAFAAHGLIWPVIISSAKEMSLVDRTRLAAAQNADLFVSIHHDSAQAKYMKKWEVDGRTRSYTDRFSGYGVFVSHKNPRYDESLQLARAVGRAMSARGFKFAPHRRASGRREPADPILARNMCNHPPSRPQPTW